LASGKAFRVIATGLRGGRANIAFDKALIDAYKNGRVPETIRFLRFRPCALIGVHQILSHEVNVNYCRSRDIEIVRRITGGGGIYLDEGQIGWELVFDHAVLGVRDLHEVARRICESMALGLNKLGVPARYRPRNDIEVDGRKISGTGGFFDGDLIFYQGTLLIDFEPMKMLACLKVPMEKLAKRKLETPTQRVITMREVLGGKVPKVDVIYDGLLAGLAEGLGIQPRWGFIMSHEEELADRIFREEIGTNAYVEMIDSPELDNSLVTASLTTTGGTVRADIRLQGPHQELIREVLITGEFFVTPPRVVFDLEAALRGLNIDEAGQAVERFFGYSSVDFLSLSPEDFRHVVEMALCQRGIRACAS
jgi:lipoate-protein ligase A